jgi:hypothetical protein
VQISPVFCYLLPLMSQYLPQQLVLEHFQPTFRPQRDRLHFTNIYISLESMSRGISYMK